MNKYAERIISKRKIIERIISKMFYVSAKVSVCFTVVCEKFQNIYLSSRYLENIINIADSSVLYIILSLIIY